MLTIIKKFTPVILDCFTYKRQIMDHYYPRPSSEYPSCDTTAAGNSFVIPMWCDLAINILNQDGEKRINWQFADGSSIAESHPSSQFLGFSNNGDMQHIKIVTPWMIKEKKGFQFLATSPQWAYRNLTQHIFPLPGVIDFKYNHSINVQSMLSYHANQRLESILIPASMPLYEIFPMTDMRIKIKTHLLSSEEYWSNYTAKFANHYMHKKKLIEKCPFH